MFAFKDFNLRMTSSVLRWACSKIPIPSSKLNAFNNEYTAKISPVYSLVSPRVIFSNVSIT